MAVTKFAGQSVIITGGASGIGRAMGSALSAHGAHVVLADIDGDGLAEAVSTIGRAGGGSTRGVTLDVRDRAAVVALVDSVVAEHGRLDIMINNAGIALGGESHLSPPEHWDRIIEVNLRGVVNGVLAAYPGMVARGTGHLVNVASMAGLAPTPLTAAYTMTKHGVVGLSTTLRPEAVRHGVHVTVICPGAVETPILDRKVPPDLPLQSAGTLTSRQFLQMMHMRPMAADRFAAQALRGIARNRAIVVVPRSGKGIWYLQRMSPAAVRGVGRLLVRRVLRKMKQE